MPVEAAGNKAQQKNKVRQRGGCSRRDGAFSQALSKRVSLPSKLECHELCRALRFAQSMVDSLSLTSLMMAGDERRRVVRG